MDPRDVERYLHDRIPLARAVGACVTRIDADGARLDAPLAPNLNHRGTAFGGSLSVLGVLAGWVVVYVGLRQADVDAHLVIQRHEVDFTAPAHGRMTAWTPTPGAVAWDAFRRTLHRRRRARLDVGCELRSAGRDVGRCWGRYVALGFEG
jgi:thioesterase domain-containing protein